MRVHISLNVRDIDKSVAFYKKMLGTDPVKLFNAGESSGKEFEKKRGYAKFDSAKAGLNLALNEIDFKEGGSLSHLGLQVGSTEEVLDFRKRWGKEGLVTLDEMEVDCCYAKQDKTWVTDPDGNEWEAFVVLEDIDASEDLESAGGVTCCSSNESEATEKVSVQKMCC